MCQIMSNDPELIALATQQQDELKDEIQLVAQEVRWLKELATKASSDAHNVSENFIGPRVQNIVAWYKAFIIFFSTIISILAATAAMWLNTNYVNRTAYEQDQNAAWGKQIGINEGSVKQFQNLELASRLANQSNEENRRLIEKMDEDIKELRRVLKR